MGHYTNTASLEQPQELIRRVRTKAGHHKIWFLSSQGSQEFLLALSMYVRRVVIIDDEGHTVQYCNAICVPCAIGIESDKLFHCALRSAPRLFRSISMGVDLSIIWMLQNHYDFTGRFGSG